jgi:dTDP-4-dehydrorhamnose 3,5-epimerase
MKVIATAIPDVRVIVTDRFGDDRGFFSETYHRARFEAAGIADSFVQDNHSLSRARGTVRGLHFQLPPFAQAKLVRVVRGSVCDVAVDLRRGSPTFGKHVCATLTADRGNQLFVPAGFAHGFCTLEPDTEVVYKVSDYYSPEHERGLLWCDPALGIEWPVSTPDATVSDRDRLHPPLAELRDVF